MLNKLYSKNKSKTDSFKLVSSSHARGDYSNPDSKTHSICQNAQNSKIKTFNILKGTKRANDDTDISNYLQVQIQFSTNLECTNVIDTGAEVNLIQHSFLNSIKAKYGNTVRELAFESCFINIGSCHQKAVKVVRITNLQIGTL